MQYFRKTMNLIDLYPNLTRKLKIYNKLAFFLSTSHKNYYMSKIYFIIIIIFIGNYKHTY